MRGRGRRKQKRKREKEKGEGRRQEVREKGRKETKEGKKEKQRKEGRKKGKRNPKRNSSSICWRSLPLSKRKIKESQGYDLLIAMGLPSGAAFRKALKWFLKLNILLGIYIKGIKKVSCKKV